MILYFLIALIPIPINAAFLLLVIKKPEIRQMRKNVLYHFLVVFLLALVISFNIFLFKHFFAVEIQYSFLRTVFVFAIFLQVLLISSFAYYCVRLKSSLSVETAYGRIWCLFGKDGEKAKKQEDRISRKKKALYALPGVFGIGYMLFFFGISETYFANVQEWLFLYRDIVLPAILFTVVFVLVLLAVFVYLLKGKYYNRGIIVLTSVFAGLYLQNAFLNTTKFINGANDTVSHLTLALNVFIWAALIVLPQVFYSNIEKSRKYIRNGAIALAGLILLIQIIPLPYLYISFENKKPENYGLKTRKENVLSGKEQFTVSSDGNVIVFVLDGYQNTNFEYHISQNPEFKDHFKDFIYFDNVATVEMNTVTSMPSLLTATPVDYTISLPESNKKAWNTGNAEIFYKDVNDAGYTVYLYSDSDDYCGDADNMIGKIANVEETEYEIVTNPWTTFFAMSKLSLYKYLPISFKDFFYTSGSEEINQYSKRMYNGSDVSESEGLNGTLHSAKDRGICMYNFDYYDGLKEGLKVEKGTKRVVFEHMFGMHKPYYGLSGKEEVSNGEEQEICATIIDEYTKQLKELGLYEDACIIITADHGFPKIGESDPLMLIKLPHYHGDEMAVNTAPGCLQSDLLPTILEIIGSEPSKIANGISLLGLPEDEPRERELHYITYDSSLPPVPKCEGIGFSYVNCYEEYRFTGRSEEIDLQKDKVGIRPLFDYWW